MNEQNNLNATPVQPVQPEVPVTPVAPIQPVVPETPVVPQNTIGNTTPITPDVNQTVINQVTPEQPVTPVVPVTPVSPATPVQQDVPVQPIVNQVNVAPVTPEQPINQNIGVNDQQPQVVPVQNAEQPVQPVQQVTPINTNPEVVSTPINQQPITGLDNNQAVATVMNGGIQSPTPGVIAPSNPINGPIDSTNVGFVQTGTELKKKKNPIIIAAIVIAILAIIGCVGYFVVYPKIMDKLSDPKSVFKSTINQVSKQVGKTVTSTIHNKGIYEVSANINSDIDVIKNFSGFTYSGRFGIDPENKLAEFGYGVTDNSTKNEFSNYYYIKNNSIYTKFSTYRELIYGGTADSNEFDEMFNSFNELLKNADSNTSEDINYIVEAWMNALANSFDDSKFSKEDASISVAGQNIKVKKNIYSMDADTITSMSEKIVNILKNDDKFIESLYNVASTSSQEVTKDSIKEALNSVLIDDSSIDKDFNAQLIIYTMGTKGTFAGIEYIQDSNNIHYYTLGNNFEIVLNQDDKDLVSAVGIAKGNTTDVSIKYEDVEYATLKISKWDENEIIFDYVLNIPSSALNDELSSSSSSDEKYVFTGNFSYKKTGTNENNKYDVSLKVTMPDKTYLTVNMSILNDWTSDVANINATTAATLSEDELNNVETTFSTYLMQTPVKYIIGTLSDINNSNSNSNSYDYSYDDVGEDVTDNSDTDYSFDY